MRPIIALIAVLSLTGCSATEEVPDNQYGVVLRLGKIEKIISGPAKARYNYFVGGVRYFNKENKLNIADGKYVLSFKVKDPRAYYIKTAGGDPDMLVSRVQQEISKQSLNGILIDSKEKLIKLIEGMSLPIEIDKNA